MGNPKTDKGRKPTPIRIKPDEVELVPDAWPKFEKLVKQAAKMGPKPHGKQGKSD
jgi:hypothetical protein